MEYLSDETLLELAENFLDVKSILRLQQAEKRFYLIYNSEHFWKKLLYRDFRWKISSEEKNKEKYSEIQLLNIQLKKRFSSYEEIKSLIIKGADPRLRPSILEKALFRNDIEFMKYIISRGAITNGLLNLAMKLRNFEIFRILIEVGVSIGWNELVLTWFIEDEGYYSLVNDKIVKDNKFRVLFPEYSSEKITETIKDFISEVTALVKNTFTDREFFEKVMNTALSSLNEENMNFFDYHTLVLKRIEKTYKEATFGNSQLP
jgi:hypothetical protein